MQTQVGLRKHHYKQSQERWWNSSWAISNPERWCCESAALNMLPNLESAVATQVKISVFILIPKTDNAKECANYCTVAIISHTSKVMFKILQASLQQRTQRSNYGHLLDHQKSKSFRKASTSALLTAPKPLTVWITTNGKEETLLYQQRSV